MIIVCPVKLKWHYALLKTNNMCKSWKLKYLYILLQGSLSLSIILFHQNCRTQIDGLSLMHLTFRIWEAGSIFICYSLADNIYLSFVIIYGHLLEYIIIWKRYSPSLNICLLVLIVFHIRLIIHHIQLISMSNCN